MPLCLVDPHQRIDGDPGDAERVGDDGAVHRFANQHLARQHVVEHRIDRPAHIDQVQPGPGCRRRPGAVDQAFPMWNKGGAVALRHRRWPGRTDQRGRISQTESGLQAKRECGARSADEIDEPAWVEPRRRGVAAEARAEYDLENGRVERIEQDRPDAQEANGRIVVQKIRDQLWPKPGVQLIAEVRAWSAEMEHLHAGATRSPAGLCERASCATGSPGPDIADAIR